MTTQPQNPFMNLPASEAVGIGAPSTGAGEGVKRSVVNRFTPLAFTGTALQLFGIQFINILLICLTLGIWIPWARVRKRRFFHNNTRILGEGLDYLASGFDIFKGWLVVMLVLVAFYAVPLFGVPFLQEGLSLMLLFVYPWAINRSLRFNARNIAWRDVRFDFKGGYFASLWYFFLLPLIGVLTLGLLMPLASKGMRDYVAARYKFGSAGFTSDAGLTSYYGAGFKTVLLFLILTVPLAVLLLVLFDDVFTLVLFNHAGLNNPNLHILLNEPPLSIMLYAIPVILFIFFIMTASYYHALTRNIMINGLRLRGGIRFRSNMSGLVLGWIMVTNLFLIVISLGLLHPWAQVRRYRYLTETVEIRPINEMRGFIDRQLKAGGSVGDAVGEAGGLEITF
jgi:uncharacterized membrane protein YjgN (DUF898 family)